MKYSRNNPPSICMQDNSTCYKETTIMKPVGVLWHSTGCNNPYLLRYIQPSPHDPNYEALMEEIGKNRYGTDYNHTSYQSGLNAWIGRRYDETITTMQSMPWDYRPWGCGTGKFGSCNSGWIQFEICEDDLQDPIYFNAVYQEACELTAYLCLIYNIDPFGYTMLNDIKVPNILCHADSYELGLGINHGDVMHWFPKYGKSMETVRQDVANLLKTAILEEEEDEDMTLEKFTELYNEMRKDLQDNDCQPYSAEARSWALATGLINGNGTTIDGEPNCMWEDILTREQFITVLYRFYQMMGNKK